MEGRIRLPDPGTETGNGPDGCTTRRLVFDDRSTSVRCHWSRTCERADAAGRPVASARLPIRVAQEFNGSTKRGVLAGMAGLVLAILMLVLVLVVVALLGA